MLCRPFESGEVTVQPYNTLLSVASLVEVSSGILLLQNETLAATCSRLLGIKHPSFKVGPSLRVVWVGYSLIGRAANCEPTAVSVAWYADVRVIVTCDCIGHDMWCVSTRTSASLHGVHADSLGGNKWP